MRKVVTVLTGSAVMLLLSAAPAMAQDSYPPRPSAVDTGPGQLARTGGDSLPLVWIGLAALVIGTLLVLAARRRSAVRTRARVSRAAA